MAKAKTKAVAWKSLEHASGKATKVPTWVKDVVGPNEASRYPAYELLRGALVAEGRWFDASAPTAALLLDSLGVAPKPHWLLMLVADILGADHARAWSASDAAAIPTEALHAHEAVTDRRGVLLDALKDARPAVRGSATVVLAMLPALYDESRPLVSAMAEDDASDVVRASALIALARIGGGVAGAKGTSPIAAALSDRHPLVRGAAALAALRLDAARPISADTEALEGWLAWKPARPPDLAPWAEDDDAQLAWFNTFANEPFYRELPFTNSTPKGLAALGASRGAAGKREALELAFTCGPRSEQGHVATQAAKIALHIGGFLAIAPYDKVVRLPDELTEEQRAVAERFARTSLLAAGGFGLPASGACRRRWLGIEPPGPIERTVEVEVAKKKACLPAWRACRALWDAGVGVTPLPPPLDVSLEGLDRWEAIITIASGTFLDGLRLNATVVEQELARLPDADEVTPRATKLADDLAERFAAAVRAGVPVRQSFAASTMLLLPLVRAGVTVEPRWDVLAYVGDPQSAKREPLAVEILNAIPRERREALFSTYLEVGPGKELSNRASVVVNLIDLAPSRRLAERIAQAAETVRSPLPDFTASILDRLAKAADAHPELRVPRGGSGPLGRG